MGYFSNGSEGADYEERVCTGCAHNKPDELCPVMSAHMLYNYEHCNDPTSILHMLIPLSKSGLGNEVCTMRTDARVERRHAPR